MASRTVKNKTRSSVKKNTSNISAKKRTSTKRPTNQSSSKSTRNSQAKKLESQKIKQNIIRTNQTLTIVLFASSILLFCLIFIKGDHLWEFMHNTLKGLFGACAIAWPILMVYISVATALEQPEYKITSRIWLCFWLIILMSTAMYVFEDPIIGYKSSYFKTLSALFNYGINKGLSGLIGGILGIPFLNLMGGIGSKIIIVLMIFVMLMILTGTDLMQLFSLFTKPATMAKNKYDNMKFEYERYTEENINTNFVDIPKPHKNRVDKYATIDIDLGPDTIEENLPHHPVIAKNKDLKRESKLDKLKSAIMTENSTNIKEQPKKRPIQEDQKTNFKDVAINADVSGAAKATQEYLEKKENNLNISESDRVVKHESNIVRPEKDLDKYNYPPLSLLSESEIVNQGNIKEELQTNGQMLVDTLKSFGVQTKIIDISRGPSVTRFELQPAAGVKISKITNLSDDIALNLAAFGVRIEAPIPGKAAVGIEIPNKSVNIVKMRELIASSTFVDSKSKLSVVLGRDITGHVTIADLAKMPHLLIAGSTGSGKSVCINSLIISLLYKSSPNEVRFLMIDPKVVELGIYNGIPHLLVPVVTDPRKAAGALGWAVTEMLKRYKIFAEHNVRNLEAYNKMVSKLRENPKEDDDENQVKLEFMPQIVIIIDELSDLMMAAPNEVEDSICRLAQMARAAGMHLVIATQRPSVDVITGIIKANIPSRIAFAVSSQIDSRTILDMGGAEKLLGRGDMLFCPIGTSKPIRVQGCFVTNEEIEAITGFVKNSDKADYDNDIIDEIEKNAVKENSKAKNSDGDSEHEEDPMLQEAIKCVVEAGQASTSLLQRRLRLGYARAGRLIDEMEQMSIVGPHEGSKPRQVLITYNQWLEMNMNKASNENTD